jgi:succinate dehydrogenase / fumarate reductase, flavoprotein subunit
LQEALKKIGGFKQRAARVPVDGSRLFNPGWHLARDLRSMLTAAEAVTRCALARKESRGAHSRIDFPEYDAEWAKKNNIIVKEDGEMNLRQQPVPEMPGELRQIMMSEK